MRNVVHNVSPMAATTQAPDWTLGDYLRKARRDAQKSVGTMAFRFGVTRKTINNWEADRTHPSKAETEVWAQFCEAEWLRDLLNDASRWTALFPRQDPELPFPPLSRVA